MTSLPNFTLNVTTFDDWDTLYENGFFYISLGLSSPPWSEQQNLEAYYEERDEYFKHNTGMPASISLEMWEKYFDYPLLTQENMNEVFYNWKNRDVVDLLDIAEDETDTADDSVSDENIEQKAEFIEGIVKVEFIDPSIIMYEENNTAWLDLSEKHYAEIILYTENQLPDGAVIRYTIDGNMPDTQSVIFDGTPLRISAALTLTAQVFMDVEYISFASQGMFEIERLQQINLRIGDGDFKTREFYRGGPRFEWTLRDFPASVWNSLENNEIVTRVIIGKTYNDGRWGDGLTEDERRIQFYNMTYILDGNNAYFDYRGDEFSPHMDVRTGELYYDPMDLQDVELSRLRVLEHTFNYLRENVNIEPLYEGSGWEWGLSRVNVNRRTHSTVLFGYIEGVILENEYYDIRKSHFDFYKGADDSGDWPVGHHRANSIYYESGEIDLWGMDVIVPKNNMHMYSLLKTDIPTGIPDFKPSTHSIGLSFGYVAKGTWNVFNNRYIVYMESGWEINVTDMELFTLLEIPILNNVSLTPTIVCRVGETRFGVCDCGISCDCGGYCNRN